MKRILALIAAVVWSMTIMAQENLTGYVFDSSHRAIVGATVVMLSSHDSTFIRGGVSDAQGRFTLLRPEGG
jgi:hypothetical protein